jgi:hypothetical protein
VIFHRHVHVKINNHPVKYKEKQQKGETKGCVGFTKFTQNLSDQNCLRLSSSNFSAERKFRFTPQIHHVTYFSITLMTFNVPVQSGITLNVIK